MMSLEILDHNRRVKHEVSKLSQLLCFQISLKLNDRKNFESSSSEQGMQILRLIFTKQFQDFIFSVELLYQTIGNFSLQIEILFNSFT